MIIRDIPNASEFLLEGGEMKLKKTARGFTLVELLVVIAIVAILAAIVVLIINPIELTKRSRDAARLTDLANLQQAINVAAQEATGSGQAILCASDWDGSACTGDSKINGRKSDGTGWTKVNLSAQKSVSVPTLPIDPLNDGSNVYKYYSDGSAWKIIAVLESEQQKGKMTTDGGPNDNEYEVGSDLSLPI